MREQRASRGSPRQTFTPRALHFRCSELRTRREVFSGPDESAVVRGHEALAELAPFLRDAACRKVAHRAAGVVHLLGFEVRRGRAVCCHGESVVEGCVPRSVVTAGRRITPPKRHKT